MIQEIASVYFCIIQCSCTCRLFDSDKVKSMVIKWVTFYKTYRDILTSDIVHVRRPDMQGKLLTYGHVCTCMLVWMSGNIGQNSYMYM